jgi:hypothetical protein
MRPDTVANALVAYLDSRRGPKSKIRVTIIPGGEVGDKRDFAHEENVASFNKLVDLFSTHKKVHVVKTRGIGSPGRRTKTTMGPGTQKIGPKTKVRGAYYVYVDKAGRIHRDYEPDEFLKDTIKKDRKNPLQEWSRLFLFRLAGKRISRKW